MNQIFYTTASVLSVLSTVAIAQAQNHFPPYLIPTSVETVYVPVGFDDNDNVEVVLYGHLYNNCVKVGPASATVSEETKTITVKAQSWSYYHQSCEGQEMYNPFTQPIQIGLLSAGTYEIKVEGRPEVKAASLVVTQRTSSTPDDFLYAPVDEMSIAEDFEKKTQTLTLGGDYIDQRNGCVVVNRVETKIVSGNVIIVLPIAEQRVGVKCAQLSSSPRFKKTVTLPGFLSGKHLIHVRVLNGQSLNRIVRLGFY